MAASSRRPRLPEENVVEGMETESSSDVRRSRLSFNEGSGIQLWVKSEILTFGALQVPPHHRLVFENLRKLINYAFVKDRVDFPRLRYSLWRRVACDKLGMAPEVAWIYFEAYDALRDVAAPQLTKGFDEESVGDEVRANAIREDVWVDVRRFALLLGIQRLHKISLRTSLSMGDEWPSSGQPPTSPRPQAVGSHSARLPATPNSDSCLAFFSGNLKNFLDLLLPPSLDPTPSTADLSLEALEALEFLVGARSFASDGTETALSLVDAATSTPEARRANGFSPSTRTFEFRQFEKWFRSRLVPDPFVAPAIFATGLHLRHWLLPSSTTTPAGSLSSCDSSTLLRLGVGSRSATQIVSNAELRPRPREKLVHLSGVLGQTIARSEDDPHLFRASVKLHRSRDSIFYLLSPTRNVLVSKCKNVLVVVCAETTVHVSQCEDVVIAAACRRLSVALSKRCVLHSLTPTNPLVLGFNEDLVFAPYNATYPELRRHLRLCNLGSAVNRWNSPYLMGQDGKQSWSLMDPEKFLPITIPFAKPEPRDEDDHSVPGGLPDEYKAALDARVKKFATLRSQIIGQGGAEKLKTSRQTAEFDRVMRARFLDWILESGHQKELVALAKWRVFDAEETIKSS